MHPWRQTAADAFCLDQSNSRHLRSGRNASAGSWGARGNSWSNLVLLRTMASDKALSTEIRRHLPLRNRQASRLVKRTALSSSLAKWISSRRPRVSCLAGRFDAPVSFTTWRAMLLRRGSDSFGFPLDRGGVFFDALVGTLFRFLFWHFELSSHGGAFGRLSLLLWGTMFGRSPLVLICRRRGLAGLNGPVAEFPAVKCVEQPSSVVCLQHQDIGKRLGPCKLETETQIAIGDVHDESV
jgi:hypothetical protein